MELHFHDRALQQLARATHKRLPSARIESVIVTNGDVVVTTTVPGPEEVTLLHIRFLSWAPYDALLMGALAVFQVVVLGNHGSTPVA